MRADLVRRGLITPGGQLTDAGNAYVDELLDRLSRQPPEPAVWGKPGVRWTRRRAA